MLMKLTPMAALCWPACCLTFAGCAPEGTPDAAAQKCETAPAVCAAPAEAKTQSATMPPYRVLYSNDTTNIGSCPASFKGSNRNFSEKYLRATIAEAKGPNVVQMLQPGLGWVPWWKSQVNPIEKHAAWRESIGYPPSSYERYVLNGGDMIAVLLDEARKNDQAAFVSIRMNDTHHVMRGMKKAKDYAERIRNMSEFQLFADNPDALLGRYKGDKERNQFAMDWSNPKVRAYKYAVLEEICKNYDIDGLELDFMRHWILFNPERTSKAEGMKIINEFVASIRQALDKYAPEGKRRWLSVRVPGYVDTQQQFYIDLKGLADAGVDMFNLSSHYFSDFQIELQAARKLVGPDKALYAEMQFVNAVGPQAPMNKWYMRRCTPTQFYTNAHLVYARGGQGVTFFNFAYYRGTYSPDDVPGEPAEPPFEVLENCAHPEWVAQQPQQYVLGFIWDDPPHKGRPLRVVSKEGVTQTFSMDMAPPAGGWKSDGKLRIQSRDSLADASFEVTFNGEKLAPNADVSDPFPNPYKVGVGAPEDYRAWTVPLKLLKDGVNQITVTQTKGGDHQLFYLDVSIPKLSERATAAE